MNDKIFSVNEIFSSIDGEGIRTGYLATFIRLNGCNMLCTYCDTPYALKMQEPNMSMQDILDKLKELKNKKITITGGEPLIHLHILDLIETLSFEGYHVNIETNGSVPLPDVGEGVFFTMDWKCISSGVNRRMYKPNLKKLTNLDVLKFVVCTEEDLEECLRIYKLDLDCYFYISPVYGMINPQEIVKFMKENDMQNATVQVQLHKIIWEPNERGV